MTVLTLPVNFHNWRPEYRDANVLSNHEGQTVKSDRENQKINWFSLIEWAPHRKSYGDDAVSLIEQHISYTFIITFQAVTMTEK